MTRTLAFLLCIAPSICWADTCCLSNGQCALCPPPSGTMGNVTETANSSPVVIGTAVVQPHCDPGYWLLAVPHTSALVCARDLKDPIQ